MLLSSASSSGFKSFAADLIILIRFKAGARLSGISALASCNAALFLISGRAVEKTRRRLSELGLFRPCADVVDNIIIATNQYVRIDFIKNPILKYTTLKDRVTNL